MVQLDTGGPRHMEFYGRRFFVKKVSCFPHDTGFFHSTAMAGAVSVQDKVVAVASHTIGQGPIHSTEFTRNVEPLMALLQPSAEAATLMAAFDKRLSSLAMHGSLQYLAAHWRRGDRGLPEMGAYGKLYWRTSHPANFACLISDMVNATGLTTVLVMTNAGRESDRHALRYYVKRWSGADVVYLEDLREDSISAKAEAVDPEGWARELVQLVAEVLLCGRPAAVRFLSAGIDFYVRSIVSRLVHSVRTIHGNNDSTTHHIRACARPHPEDAPGVYVHFDETVAIDGEGVIKQAILVHISGLHLNLNHHTINSSSKP